MAPRSCTAILYWIMRASQARSLLEPVPEERDGARPGLLRGLRVGAVAVLLGAQEAVARAFVDVGLVDLPEPLHLGLGGRDRGVHARVVAAVETEHGCLDLREVHRRRRNPVVNDRGIQSGLRRGVIEARAAPPAAADRRARSIG